MPIPITITAAPPNAESPALPGIVPADLKAIWKSGNDIDRREFACELLQVYDQDWCDLLDNRLRDLFLPQNYAKLKLRADTSINLLSWASDELGGIYAESATRTIDGEEDGLEPYTNDGELDAALDEAARLCFALRQIVLRPLVVEREDGPVIVLDVITPDKCCVIPNEKDPLKIDAIAVEISPTRWSLWTEANHWVVDPSWKRVSGEGSDDGLNPYGVIPYVVCHAKYPTRKHWSHRRSAGLLEATYQTGVGKTDHQHLRHFSSFKQMYYRSDKKDEDVPKMMADPTSVVHVRGQNAEVGTIDMQANLAEHLDTLMQGAQATLALYGIRPEAVRGQIDASSGYALSLKMHKQQQVWGSYRIAWARNERRVYSVAKVVWAKDTGQALPDGKLQIEYAELGPGQDPMEQAERAEVLGRVGYSTANIMREVFGKDDEWIESNEAERMDERLAGGGMVPFGEAPAAAPGVDPFPDDEELQA